MDNFSIGKILAGIKNPEIYLKKLKQDGLTSSENSFNNSLSQPKTNVNNLIQSTASMLKELQMNQLANCDRAVYIRNLLGLPPTLQNLFMSIMSQAQNKNDIQTINQNLLNQLNALAPDILNNQQTTQNSKDITLLMFSGMIQMSDISNAILKNSKQAVANLILAMSSASKSGMTSEQIRDTLGIISSCVNMAEQNNPAQTLKSLMLLYLPWLPLNEGIGFDLEISTPEGENESSNSKLTVLIQTKNFGNVKGVFTLTTKNSVDIYILCSESFPKNTLQKLLKQESTTLSMVTSIDIEAVKPKEKDENANNETKVNLSATNEMNPYLLLMAHSFIRQTIYIDSNQVTEIKEET